VPPSARGGHTATLTGATIIIFGGHFYKNSKEGFTYLNDTLVLDVEGNNWIQPNVSGSPPQPR